MLWLILLFANIQLIKINGQDWPNLSKYKYENAQLKSLKKIIELFSWGIL